MGNLAIIPARGGSKRIPRKNIREFLGKPIIAYSIETALRSGLFEEVMVSTDDPEIAEVARRYGAIVPFMRSNENANDFASTVDVILEVLSSYGDRITKFSRACCIYPTAPLVTSDSLEKGLRLLVNENFSTVFAVVPFSYPIWRAINVLNDSKAELFWPENVNKRSQDLTPAYHDAGQFYWFDVSQISKRQQLFTKYTGVIILNEMEVQDIDTLTDWQMAEMKFKLLNEA